MLSKMVCALPFCAGLLIFNAPQDPQRLALYLKVFCLFLLLFGSLAFLLRLVAATVRGRSEPSQERERTWRLALQRVSFYASVALIALVLFASLQILRRDLLPLVFSPIVALVFIRALQEKLHLNGRHLLHCSCALLYYSGISYVSINLVAITWIVGPLIFSVSLACMTVAVQIAAQLEAKPAEPFPPPSKARRKKAKQNKEAPPPPPPSTRSLRILYSFLILLGPSLVGFLTSIRMLPPAYALSLVVIPLTPKIIAALDLKSQESALPSLFLRNTTGLCLLHAAMILLAAWLQPFN
jgi:hypothetical protein